MAKYSKIFYCKNMIYDNKEIKRRFGAKIREYRKIANLTQEQLAEKVGCSWQTISGMETGYSFPSSKILFNLSEALNMPLVYLFNFYSNPIDNEIETKFINLFKQLDKVQQNMLLKVMKSLIDEKDD